MLTGLLYLLGVVLVLVGVLKFLGVFALASAAAVPLIVVGLIIILVAYVVSSRYHTRL